VCTLCYFHDKLAPLAKFNSTTEDRNEATWGGDEGDTETRPLVTRHSSAIGTRSPSEEAPPSLTERGEVGQKQTPAVTGARMSTGEISRYLAKLGAEMLRERTRDSQEPRPASVGTSHLRTSQSSDTLRPTTSSSFLQRRAFKLRLDSQAQNPENSWIKRMYSTDSSPMSLFRGRQEDEEAKDRRLRNFSLSNAVRFYISSRETK
jgi:hypothetical protein